MSQQTISKIILGMAAFFLVATVTLKMFAITPPDTGVQEVVATQEVATPLPTDSTHDVGPITAAEERKSFAKEIMNIAINDPVTGELVLLNDGIGEVPPSADRPKVSTIKLTNIMLEQTVGLRNDIVAIAEIRSGEDLAQSFLLMFSERDGIWFHVSSIQVGENAKVVALAADKKSSGKSGSGEYTVSVWTEQYVTNANSRNKMYTVNVVNGIFDYQSVMYK